MRIKNSIPEKANVVLNLILIGLIVIAVRIWHLSVIQYEEKFEQSKKPQRKTVIEPASRATIRDRFNIPLAFNKIVYKAAVAYSPIRQIPSVAFELDGSGNKVKIFKRKEYIRQLSELLADELGMDGKRVEDLIYSKAALYFNIPYTLKQDISESQYYRLRMLEKDWPGLVVEKYSKREYPKGRSAADLVGYMGAISREEYEKVIIEKKALSDYLTEWEKGEDPEIPFNFSTNEEVRRRLKSLEALAYTAQDFVGKTGIEALFEQELRGFQGKKTFYADSKGNLLKELPGTSAKAPGKRILLAISHELQEYAESLLAQNESLRLARSSGHGKKTKNQKQPWIKGGAVVALDPHSGEVLALATYPRYNPSDFIAGNKKNINKWFENEHYLAALWNEEIPLEKELYDSRNERFYEEKQVVSWPFFLERLLPKNHPILEWFEANNQIKDPIAILKEIDALESEGVDLNQWVKQDSALPFFSTPYTKLLFIDCCQLAVNHAAFSADLQRAVGNQSIQSYKEAGVSYFVIQNAVRQLAEEIFHREVFSRWRDLNEKKFLKEKRDAEKLAKVYPKPYLDLLDEKERELFQTFWERVSSDFSLILLKGSAREKSNCFTDYFKQMHLELANGAHPALPWRSAYDKLQKILKEIPSHLVKEYLATLRSHKDLTRKLKGKYRGFRNKQGPQLEKHLASAIYPTWGFGYGRSFAYRQASTQGSIFKIVTAHEALLQANEDSLKAGKGIKNKNPLDIIDDIFKIGGSTFIGYNAAGKPISQQYKGGRIPRSRKAKMGKMDLLYAIETSSNPYFSLLASDILKNPNDLAEAAKRFGFGKKTGIELPGEIGGKVPSDLETNRTGLYATAIGQHSLVVTPLQTALFLSSLANGGDVLKPQVIKYLIGSSYGQEEDLSRSDPDSKEQRLLYALGIDFPLFETSRKKSKNHLVERRERTILNKVEMQKPLRNLLLEGMRRVVSRTHQDSLGSLSRLYKNHPEALSDYVDLKNQIVGKTSTSEQMERIDMDEVDGTNLYTHVWFGGISFEKDVNHNFDNPELVVVVYLRFGAFGKEAAPVAAQIVRKWREIKTKYEK